MGEALINAVYKHPPLYNMNSHLYRNFSAKEDAWADVSNETGLPVDECKTKWRSMRDRFVREKRKLVSLDCGLPGKNGYWELMPYLEFLTEFMAVHRGASSNKKRCQDYPKMTPDMKNSNKEAFSKLLDDIQNIRTANQDEEATFGNLLAARMRGLPRHIQHELQDKFLTEVRQAHESCRMRIEDTKLELL